MLTIYLNKNGNSHCWTLDSKDITIDITAGTELASLDDLKFQLQVGDRYMYVDIIYGRISNRYHVSDINGFTISDFQFSTNENMHISSIQAAYSDQHIVTVKCTLPRVHLMRGKKDVEYNIVINGIPR